MVEQVAWIEKSVWLLLISLRTGKVGSKVV
jgi:hypothetical protein